MSLFSRIKGVFSSEAKSLNEVIFPTWDSSDTDGFLHSRRLKRSKTEFLNINELTLYVNRAIDKRAEKVSQIEFELRRGEKILEDHQILTLLNRPNSKHTGRQFWKLYQKYLDVTGTAYIYVARSMPTMFSEEVELHLLRPDCVRVLWHDGEIVGYEFKPPHGQAVTYAPDEIIYAFNPDPLNPGAGASLLQAGIRAIDTENQLADYHSAVLHHGGKVDTVISVKNSTLTSTQLKEMKEDYKAKYAEARNAGLPMFLSGDTKIDRLALNPEELSYLESKKMTLNDICLLTGVPRAILSQGSDETYANAEAAYSIFLRETIKPLLEGLTTILDWRFVPEEFDLSFVDPTPEDIDRKTKTIKTAHEVNAVTINEKREMLGLEPLTIPEADQIYIPFNVMPLEQADEEPAPQEPPADEEAEDDQKGKKKAIRSAIRKLAADTRR